MSKILKTFSCLKELGIDRSNIFKVEQFKPNKSKKIKVKVRTVGDYRQYLKTKWWKARRLKFIGKNPFCYCCGDKASEVNHRCYARKGREKDKDLVAICRDCHENIHTLILNNDDIFLKNGHLIYKSLLSLKID